MAVIIPKPIKEKQRNCIMSRVLYIVYEECGMLKQYVHMVFQSSGGISHVGYMLA